MASNGNEAGCPHLHLLSYPPQHGHRPTRVGNLFRHTVCTIHRWAELSDVGSKCVGGGLVNCPCCSDPHVIDWETTAATKLLHNSAMQLTDLIR
jgi:hypothetical protein